MAHMISFVIIPNGPKGGVITSREYPISALQEKGSEIAVFIQKSINEAKKVVMKSSKYKNRRWTIDFNSLRIIKTSLYWDEYPLKQFLQNIYTELLRREKLLRRKKCRE